ncbi:MAG TPA: hypothetical protein VHE81_19425 [Lacipirellulaceae bacterium]|nr:hypothetical protein [Lacipirellulaceae bacterium]
MRWWLFLLSVVITAVVGCRSLRPMSMEQEVRLPLTMKLPEAHTLRAGQLVFHSDFELPSDHRLIRELTMERDDVYGTLGLEGSTEPIEVYLFRDADRYAEFLKRDFPSVPSRRAFFLETDTRLTVYAHWSDRVGEDLRHEVAHGYLHAAVPQLPLWLDEGLAEYFEVPHWQEGLNRPHVDLLYDMATQEHWRPNLPRLEKLTEAAQMGQSDYAESWAWVYFFLKSPPERRKILTDYIAELRTLGESERLSARLAALHVDPEQPMAAYVASLKQTTDGAMKK